MILFISVICKRRVLALMMTICGLCVFTLYGMAVTWCAVVPLGDPQPGYNVRQKDVLGVVVAADHGNGIVDVDPKDSVIQRHSRVLQNSNRDFYVKADPSSTERGERSLRTAKTYQEPALTDLKQKLRGDNSIFVDDEDQRNVNDRDNFEARTKPYYRTSSELSHEYQNATKKLPEAIIIGVKKAGTRALLEFLRIHPDVRAPGPEPHFFDRNYDKGLEWYRSQMPATLPGQLTIEKTPSYFVTREVPQRVHDMSKSVKLIVVVRDPVTRAISDYTQALSKRPEIKPFEQWALLDNRTRLVNSSWGAIRIGVYPKHLEHWLKFFPLEQIHFVNGERLIEDPAGEIEQVQSFLGLRQYITDKHFYLKEPRGFPCIIRNERTGRHHCLGKTKGRPHPRVDEDVIARLRDFYRPFNLKFYHMVKRKFDWR